MTVKLDATIRVENLLTLATIIGSVVAFLTSWASERELEELRRADRMRTAAALAIAKLERWQVLQRSLYDEIQPTLVEVSEMLVSDFDVGKARDYFWKTLDKQHVNILKSLQEERIDTAYLDLLAFDPSYRVKYVGTLEQLREVERQCFSELKQGGQSAVLSFGDKRATYQSALLGNALRAVAGGARKSFDAKTEAILEKAREPLLAMMRASVAEH